MIKFRRRKENLDNSYLVQKLQICPFEKIKCGDEYLIHPLRNDGYEYVLCVCDFENNRVIDIMFQNQYRYIELLSAYMLNKEKIINQKRYAIRPLNVNEYELSNEEIIKLNNIQKKLKLEKKTNIPQFINGNYVLNNEEYKELVNKEKVLNKVKIKRR